MALPRFHWLMLVPDTCSQYDKRTSCLDVLTKQHWSDHPAYNAVKDMVQHEMPHPSDKMVQCNLQFDSVSFEWLFLLHNSSNDFGIMTPQDIQLYTLASKQKDQHDISKLFLERTPHWQHGTPESLEIFTDGSLVKDESLA